MESTQAQRIGAGLSLLFADEGRPDLAVLRAALAACQTSVGIVRSDEAEGTADLIVSGLLFEVDGLAPARAEAVRVFPGHALSGGLTMRAVVRALLALAAELADRMRVAAVRWHPADITIEPRAFSRSVLAWLAGGAFPAPGLVALTPLADGSVVSRGLAHFTGQEVIVRGEGDAPAADLAPLVVDRLVREGPLHALTQWRLQGTLLNAEPAREAKQILVWPTD